MRVVFVVNPRSAGGGTGRRLTRVRKLVDQAFGRIAAQVQFVSTEGPGHATELAAQHGPQADLLVSVGGDGTANEVANGLARLALDQRPTVGVLPAGTGSDLVRTLAMPPDLHDAIGVLARGRARAVDWVRVRYTTPEGERERICLNVAGFGLSGVIVGRVNQSSKRLGGRITFAAATARALAGWRAPRVGLRWEGPAGPGSWEGPIFSVFLANGQYCGGGMWVGRGGSMSDGVAELTVIPELSLGRAAINAPRLYTGKLAAVPGVIREGVSSVSAEALDDREVPLDLDGEQPGALPVQLQVEGQALRLVGQWVG